MSDADQTQRTKASGQFSAVRPRALIPEFTHLSVSITSRLRDACELLREMRPMIAMTVPDNPTAEQVEYANAQLARLNKLVEEVLGVT